MNTTEILRKNIKDGVLDERFALLYPQQLISAQKERYYRVILEFEKLFGEGREAGIFSAPGRTEICGNHTDHNHGCVLAASVNLDAIAVAAKSEGTIVNVKSEGYKKDTIDLNELEPKESEFGRSVALVRGVCAEFKNRGYNVGAFDAATASDVLSGSGLSSSAAFEVLLGTIINYLFNDGKVSAVEVAQIAQVAENKFFGKPCGLLDQMTSSVGAFVKIDFADPSKPQIEKLDFDFSVCGHALCIVDTGGNHSDLTDEYAAVRKEMESVAEFLGESVLRDVCEDEFKKNIPAIREKCGDRAVLRAMHFYADNARVEKQASALKAKDFETFKKYIIESGRSSYMYNQNVFTCKNTAEQSVSLALALSESALDGCGAWRVHGGGFAGTIQAFVPNDKLDSYKALMEKVFGVGSCYVLSIRPVGGVEF
ncbi:MAG: galactokinase [Clostridia bacterium]|nr:galactokinase [Clostridia bacterium]